MVCVSVSVCSLRVHGSGAYPYGMQPQSKYDTNSPKRFFWGFSSTRVHKCESFSVSRRPYNVKMSFSPPCHYCFHREQSQNEGPHRWCAIPVWPWRSWHQRPDRPHLSHEGRLPNWGERGGGVGWCLCWGGAGVESTRIGFAGAFSDNAWSVGQILATGVKNWPIWGAPCDSLRIFKV